VHGSGNLAGVAVSTWGTAPTGLNAVGVNADLLQGGSVLSTTNGLYSNLLQGNAVLSTSNPIFVTGTGSAGTAATNVLTVQGIASMTPLLANPGTAANWAIGATGSSVPANAQYTGLNNGGNSIGWIGDSSGRGIVVGAGTAGTASGGVLTVQGVASMTPFLANPGTAAKLGGPIFHRNQIKRLYMGPLPRRL
jgi:hypothetical protein